MIPVCQRRFEMAIVGPRFSAMWGSNGPTHFPRDLNFAIQNSPCVTFHIRWWELTTGDIDFVIQGNLFLPTLANSVSACLQDAGVHFTLHFLSHCSGAWYIRPKPVPWSWWYISLHLHSVREQYWSGLLEGDIRRRDFLCLQWRRLAHLEPLVRFFPQLRHIASSCSSYKYIFNSIFCI